MFSHWFRSSPRRTKPALLRLQLLDERIVPSNDFFANAISLSGTAVNVSGSNVGFTVENGEASLSGSDFIPTSKASAWWVYKAPASGALTLTLNHEFSTVTNVFTGDSLQTLSPVSYPVFQDPAYPFMPALVTTVQEGQTYYIGVDGINGQTGNISFELTLPERPVNDDFVDAIVVSGDSVSVTGDNTGATMEPGEPAFGFWGPVQHQNSIWYSWRATKSGPVVINGSVGEFGGQVGMFIGDAVNTLSMVGFSFGSPLIANVVEGQIYHIGVASPAYVPSSGGPVQLTLEVIAPPVNDDFINAIEMTGLNWVAYGSNIGATGEAGEPDHGAGEVSFPWGGSYTTTSVDPLSGQLGSIWYSWTAPQDGRVTLDTFGSDFNTSLGVYVGDSVDNLSLVAGVDDPMPYVQSARLGFHVSAGKTYRIAVDGSHESIGHSKLALSYAPANDDFADAQPLVGDSPTITGDNTGSTLEPGEFFGGYDPSTGLGNSVWYAYTPSVSGMAMISGVPYGVNVGVFSGKSLDALTPLSLVTTSYLGPDDLPGFFDVTAGETYFVSVGGQFGPFEFQLTGPQQPGVYLTNGVLSVYGTDLSEEVSLWPIGSASDGSTGVRVRTNIGGSWKTHTFAEPVLRAQFFMGGGNDSVQLRHTMALPSLAILGAGDDSFRGGSAKDVVFGDGPETTSYFIPMPIPIPGPTPSVSGGNDYIWTGNGDDVVFAGQGNNTIDLGEGDNYASAGDGNNLVRGGDGKDFIVLGNGNNVVRANDGNNSIFTGSGNDEIRTGKGSDTIYAGDGNNIVWAGNGENFINTGQGNDTIWGGADSDFVHISGGDNRIETFGGDDTVSIMSWFFPMAEGILPPSGSGESNNLIRTGAGNDTVMVQIRGKNVIETGSGDDVVVVQEGDNVIEGGSGNDLLVGGSGKDVIRGGSGFDVIVGGLGADMLYAGPDNDLLFAGQVGNFGAMHLLQQIRQLWVASPDSPETYMQIRDLLNTVDPWTGLPLYFDDGEADTLHGGTGRDWFWAFDPSDRILEKAKDELIG